MGKNKKTDQQILNDLISKHEIVGFDLDRLDKFEIDDKKVEKLNNFKIPYRQLFLGTICLTTIFIITNSPTNAAYFTFKRNRSWVEYSKEEGISNLITFGTLGYMMYTHFHTAHGPWNPPPDFVSKITGVVSKRT